MLFDCIIDKNYRIINAKIAVTNFASVLWKIHSRNALKHGDFTLDFSIENILVECDCRCSIIDGNKRYDRTHESTSFITSL